MSDRPSAINGKRSQAWGTMSACPACGQCLCFGCHPDGPCVDDHEAVEPVSSSVENREFAAAGADAWMSAAPAAPGASGLRMRSIADATDARLR